ncbi:STAS domain-containing protein [Streptomyces sp. enrichment culture]|uniref:STAS domain-containing protein n=1 Tax=Streptomyces sp. enrichment culture TaxID=1795815 RepID=UPI003F559E9E
MTRTERADQPRHLSAGHRMVDGVRVVTLRGEIDHDVQEVLREALLGVGESVPARIVADLSGVTFMDSSGVNVFVAAHLQTTDAHGWVRIAGAPLAVRRVLQVTGVDTFIGCHLTIEQALTA